MLHPSELRCTLPSYASPCTPSPQLHFFPFEYERVRVKRGSKVMVIIENGVGTDFSTRLDLSGFEMPE